MEEAGPKVDDVNPGEVAASKSDVTPLIDKIKPSSYGLKRTYSTIDISADRWLLVNDPASLEKLETPPSLEHGLKEKHEKEIRYLGCELIQLGAILLKLPQTAAATGQILFHRFYYQKSFVRYNFEHTVMACLLLASKIEEAIRRPRDVLNVFNRLKQLNYNKRPRPLPLDANYKILKELVIKAERRILNTLGFVVHVHHPHKLIYVYLHSLKLLHTKQLLQKAWSYMNDGLRTDIFLRYRPETIACACIHLAARTIDEPIVLPKYPFPWFELFDASDRDVKAISSILAGLYNRSEVSNWQFLSAKVEHLAKLLQAGNKQGQCDKVRLSIQEKFEEMKESIVVVEKKSVEKHASESVKNRGNERRKDNYNENRDRDKEKRRNDHERGRDIVFKDKLAKRSRSRSPHKVRRPSRSPHYRKNNHSNKQTRRRHDR